MREIYKKVNKYKKWKGSTSLKITAILLFIIFTFSPMLTLLVDFIIALFSNGLNHSLNFISDRHLILLIQTFTLAVSVSATGIILGFFIAIKLWQLPVHWSRTTILFLVTIALIPPYVHALSWKIFFNTANSFLSDNNYVFLHFDGWLASWWVQLMSFLPFVVLLAFVALRSIEREKIEAALLLQSPVKLFYRLLFPATRNLLYAGGCILFLLSILDYSIPSLFQYNVYSLEIYAEFSSNNSSVDAFLISIPLLAISIFIVILLINSVRNSDLSIKIISPNIRRLQFPVLISILFALVIGILFLQFIMPVLTLLLSIESFEKFYSTINNASSDICYSLKIVVFTLILSLTIAYLFTLNIGCKLSHKKMFLTLLLIPFVIPAPLVGIGIIFLWNNSIFYDLYRSDLMPVLASVARFTPIIILIMLSQRDNYLIKSEEASKIYQPDKIKILIKTKIPLMLPGFITATIVLSILTLSELGATLLVIPPGNETLTIRIYNYLHYGGSSSVAGLCLLMLFLPTFILITVFLTRNRVSYLNPSNWSRYFD